VGSIGRGGVRAAGWEEHWRSQWHLAPGAEDWTRRGEWRVGELNASACFAPSPALPAKGKEARGLLAARHWWVRAESRRGVKLYGIE